MSKVPVYEPAILSSPYHHHVPNPAKPEDDNYIWYHEVLVDLDTAKTRRANLTTQERDSKIEQGVDFDGGRYDSDEKSQNKINGAVTVTGHKLASGVPAASIPGVLWRKKDNTSKWLDADKVIGLGDEFAAHVKKCHYEANLVKSLANSATTTQEVIDIEWPDYLGEWDASANEPAITDGIGAKGAFYLVSASGETSVDGTASWLAGSAIYFNGIQWIPVTI